jgi:hypothetical protein
MARALDTVHTIRRATTDADITLGFAVLVRGPLRSHADALEDLWTRLRAGLLRKRFVHYRRTAEPTWRQLPEPSKGNGFAATFGMKEPLLGHWGVELSDEPRDLGTPIGHTVLELRDLAPVRGIERLSHLRVLFGSETAVGTITALGEWASTHLPLWWGSAGFVFHHTHGTMFTAHKRMAALAKRYWGVQIQDMTVLQWDGLRGMPGINWLTLIGPEFAAAKGISLDALAAAASEPKFSGVFQRRATHAIAIAAGSKPLHGDINVGEDMSAYVQVDRLLHPLLLTEHTPLYGPFAKSQVLRAWLRRFEAPREWLECDIATE